MSVTHFCFSLPLVMFLSPLNSRVVIVPEYRGDRTCRTYPSETFSTSNEATRSSGPANTSPAPGSYQQAICNLHRATGTVVR